MGEKTTEVIQHKGSLKDERRRKYDDEYVKQNEEMKIKINNLKNGEGNPEVGLQTDDQWKEVKGDDQWKEVKGDEQWKEVKGDEQWKEVKGDKEVNKMKENENLSSDNGTVKDEKNSEDVENNKSNAGQDVSGTDGDEVDSDMRDKSNHRNHDNTTCDDEDDTDSSKSIIESDTESDDEKKLKQKNNTVNWVLKDVTVRKKAGNLKSDSHSSLCINIQRSLAGDREQAVTTSKSVDFSLPASMDDVDEEINQVINSCMDDQMQFGFNDQISNPRALTVNTPATELTDSHFRINSIRTPVREKYYEHALMVMNRRCKSGSTYLTSAGMRVPQSIRTASGRHVPVYNLPSLVAHINKPPFSSNPNTYFYVTQKTQQQFSPLKAWKGYHGNVYFEPMTCKHLDIASSDKYSQERTKSADETSKNAHTHLPDLEERTQSRVSDTKTERSKTVRSTGSNSAKSVASRTKKLSISQRSLILPKMRQMSILDKRSVIRDNNPRIREDMSWISSQESTGSLCIGRPRQLTTLRAYSDSNKHYRLKICRGIASRSHDSTDEQSPAFSLKGGRLNESWSAGKSRPELETPDDKSGIYRYSSAHTSIPDGSHDNANQSSGVIHVVPSPNQSNSRQLNVRDTSFHMTYSH
ncbi:uncharacterized protein LOC117110435 isoform X2 [Anneissia japonica]|uniref:uncharacterized protein LOC117110435 isoform X2 n=1 Tax=Anneissia japonica TaxID=1529436 RepID=UPI001425AF7A|nr:uncharacterized protein LOC117110435 isoform X2 [Anneissia japonica]